MFWFGLIVGAVGTSLCWWIAHRGFSGVWSDLTDAVRFVRRK